MSSLEQTAQLTKLIEQQNKFFEAQEATLKSQLNIMNKIVEATEKAGEAGGASSKMLDLGKALEKAAEDSDKLGSKSEKTGKSLLKMFKDGDLFSKKFGERLKNMGKMGLLLSPIIGAIDGIRSGFQFSLGVGQSFINVLSSVTRSIFDLGMAIVTAPFKILTGLMEMASNSSTDFMEALEGVRKEFGDMSTTGGKAVRDLTREMRGGLAETGLSTFRVFGKLSERLKFVAEVAGDLGATFDVLSSQIASNMERFGAYIKGLGLSSEAIQGLGEASFATGKNITDIGREITTFAFGVGETFGLSGKMISRDIGSMIKDVGNFGNLSTKTMANVSIFARRLGVDFTKLLGVVSKFDDFESAAEGAAQLAQAFGLNVDALKMVEAQDPAERIEMLRKSFFAAGRTIETMTRQERALLEQQTGLEQSALRMVFSNKNKATSYKEIQKQSDATAKKQLTQEEAMQKLSNSIERLVINLGDMGKSFTSIFVSGFFKGMEHTGSFMKMMISLRRAMTSTFMAGRRLGQFFVKFFPGVSPLASNLSSIFQSITKHVKMLSAAFTQTDKKGKPVIDSFEKGMTKIREIWASFTGDTAGNFDGIIQALKDFGKKAGEIFGGIVKFAMEGLSKAIRGLTDFILNPSEALKKAEEGGGEFSKIVKEIFAPAIEAIKKSWPELKDAFVEMFSVLWEKMKPALKDAVPYVLAFMFGPAVISGVLTAITASLGGLLITALSVAIKFAVVKAIPFLFMGLLKIFTGAATMLVGAVGLPFVLVGAAIIAAIAGIVYLVVKHWDTIKEHFNNAINWAKNIGSIISGIYDEAVKVIEGVIDGFVSWIQEAGKSIAGFFTGIKDGISSFLTETVPGFFTSIQTFGKDIYKEMIQTGENIINGLIEGFKSKFNAVTEIFSELGSNIIGGFKSILGIQSPSTVFREMGENTSEGFTEGLSSKFASVKNTVADFGKNIFKGFSITGIGDKLSGLNPFGKDGIGTKGISNLTNSLNSVTGLAGNIGKVINQIGDKDFSDKFGNAISNIAKIPLTLTNFSSQIESGMKLVNNKSIEKMRQGVTAMVKEINEMSSLINSARDININSDLKVMANKLGLGSSDKLEINMKDLKININVDVKLLVEDIEEAMLTKPGGSKFTFALSEGQ